MSARTPGIGRVGIWAGNFDALPATELRQASAAIENLGYGALWFPETTGREAMAQAAILLAGTRRVTVAAGMTRHLRARGEGPRRFRTASGGLTYAADCRGQVLR